MTALGFRRGLILSGSAWTIGTYAASVVMRFGSNVILTKLVAPDVFGMSLVITTIKIGADLLSDVGISQNIVSNKSGHEPRFYNTAWTIQLVRGLGLCAVCFALSGYLAETYKVPAAAIQLGAIALAVQGAVSTSIPLLQKDVRIASLMLFDLTIDLIGTLSVLLLVAWSPTIWAILCGHLVATLARVVGSFLLAGSGNRLCFDRAYAAQILSFGKWIFLYSLIGFMSVNFDRLYIGSIAPLAVLGVYGIARSIADLPAVLVGRLAYSLIFPIVAAAGQIPHAQLRREIGTPRLLFLVAAAVALGCATACADLAVRTIYDARYEQAAFMLPLLLVGTWATILCTINEYVLIGRGKPQYATVATSIKLVYLLIGLPLAFRASGLMGAIAVLICADVVRYTVLVSAQARARISFGAQDLLATACLLMTLLAISWVRALIGLGTAFDGLHHL
ncbi:oligosaccharide flippase family protein [Methylobacterium sp. NEAU 140]|uniref:oligosaccharide flippase family protein n=1 Tax=Methylobacterium sp. NEAU 140 TaxID=3064945 RepID=UPI002733F66E|nr:oligosaccharide flippase family protein [Methylobacterium sp. NEAU 140]MDP4023743.1 oligosaccharide flippase family protein [Methylobacterium sp. NEAU 140]